VAAFDDFLAEYGSRGPNEWDVMAETWETRPALALALVDRMRHLPDEQAPAAGAARLAAARRRLSEDVGAALAGNDDAVAQFNAAVASAAVFVPGRERSKTNIIRVIGEVRVALRELGRRAVERGQLGEPADLCLLFEDELRALTVGEPTDVSAIVERRAAYHRWLRSLDPPFIIDGRPPPITTWPPRSEHHAAKAEVGDQLQGVPGCPGTARGRACVVLDPADPAVLEGGDILVAPVTDPAWTPLFVPAAGVVVDVGAPLSHAIIVSRELGVPCAVSVTDATKRIPHGATIEVDGSTGTVTVLALP
jgi:rifampicin phosphotransferase